MTFNEVSGNMYPWVDCTHTHHRGGCLHGCSYCFTQHMRCKRFYTGPLTLKESELKRNYYKYGKNKTIFVEHMTDLFAEGVPAENIEKILAHCKEYPENTYVYQTKNPKRMIENYYTEGKMQGDFMMGTTIETNSGSLTAEYSNTPTPHERAVYIGMVRNHQTFVTIEPIMRFNLHELTELVRLANPSWVNIGADSKNQHLPEPSWNEVMDLIKHLESMGVKVKEKANLDRLRG
jgi:protein gp37